ncbi:hypothetical protein HY485_05105 [Candidatus Woesearchaeota archaeon]|nr:hypothetical protein [Candidatus Woesearchaeota archaeon]
MPDEKPVVGASRIVLKTFKKRDDLEEFLKSVENKGGRELKSIASGIAKNISGFSEQQISELMFFVDKAYGKTASHLSFLNAVKHFVELSKQSPELIPQCNSAVRVVNEDCMYASSLEELAKTWGRLGINAAERDEWVTALSSVPGQIRVKQGGVEEFLYHDDNYRNFFVVSAKHFNHPTAQKRALLRFLPQYDVFYALDFLLSVVDTGDENKVDKFARDVSYCVKTTQQELSAVREQLIRKYCWDAGKIIFFDKLLYNEVVVSANSKKTDSEPLKKELLKFCSLYGAKNARDPLEFFRLALPIIRRVGVKAGLETTRSVREVLETNDGVRSVGYLTMIEGICNNDDLAFLGKEEFEKLVYVANAVYPALDRNNVFHLNDLFSRVFKLDKSAREQVIKGAGRIVYGLKRKEVPAKAIEENVVAYVNRVLSEPAGSSSALNTAIDGRVLPYMSTIAAAMPSGIDGEMWTRLVDIVGNKHEAMVADQVPNRPVIMEAFVRDLLIRFGAMRREQQEFFFEQLDLAKTKLNGLRPSYIAEKIMPLVEQTYRTLSIGQAEALCATVKDLSRIIKNSVVKNGERASEPFEELPNRVEMIVNIPEEYRTLCINGAQKVVDAANAFSCNPNDIRKVTDAYFKVMPEKVVLLKKDFTQWLAFGVSQSRSVDKLVEYLTDESGYFDDAHITDVAAVRLDDVGEILQRYVESLTGKAVVVQKSPQNELSCSMDGNKVFLPGVVKASRDVDRNFGVFKALASYQAGMIEAGTFVVGVDKLDCDIRKRFGDDASISNFFASYENPALVRSLFEIVELERVDKFLRNNYPGLKRDLDFFRKYKGCSHSPVENAGDVQLLLDGLYQKLMTGSVDIKVLKAMSSKVSTVLENAWNIVVAEKDCGGRDINRTLWVVDTLYTLAGCFIDVKAPVASTPVTGVAIALDRIVDNGKGSPSPLIAMPSDEAGVGRRFRYDEWDSKSLAYRHNAVQLFERSLPVKEGFAKGMFDNAAIQRLRKRFELLKPEEHVVVRKQRSGDVDYDALVKAKAEMNAGITPSDKIYSKELVRQRSVAAMVVSELSGSLRKFVDIMAPKEKLIDIVKQSAIYFSEAIDAIGDPLAIAGYSGETAKRVEFYLLKDFDVQYSTAVRDAIASLSPLQQNRDGAGIRHATHLLARRPEKTKILFYLMEGVPHDFEYENLYAIEDTKKAVIEAKRAGCIPVVLAYGSKIDEKMRSIGQHAIYREVRDAKELPFVLPNLYARLTV